MLLQWEGSERTSSLFLLSASFFLFLTKTQTLATGKIQQVRFVTMPTEPSCKSGWQYNALPANTHSSVFVLIVQGHDCTLGRKQLQKKNTNQKAAMHLHHNLYLGSTYTSRSFMWKRFHFFSSVSSNHTSQLLRRTIIRSIHTHTHAKGYPSNWAR